jgi:hypothetical protein
MRNTRPAPAILLSLMVLIVVRRAFGGQSVFRGEFLIEDFIGLLAVVFGVVPSRFKPLIWRVIGCLIGITMALLAWTTGRHTLFLPWTVVCTVLFAFLAIYSAGRALIELSKLRKRGTGAGCAT